MPFAPASRLGPTVSLPLSPPLAPQLAKTRTALPEGDNWAYEPKWDGFRAIAFVDGDQLVLLSRGGKDLVRYFPELTFPPGRYVPQRLPQLIPTDPLGLYRDRSQGLTPVPPPPCC